MKLIYIILILCSFNLIMAQSRTTNLKTQLKSSAQSFIEEVQDSSGFMENAVYVLVLSRLDTTKSNMRYSLSYIHNENEFNKVNAKYYFNFKDYFILVRQDYFIEKKYGNWFNFKKLSTSKLNDIIHKTRSGSISTSFGKIISEYAIDDNKRYVLGYCDNGKCTSEVFDENSNNEIPYQLLTYDWDYLKCIDRVNK